MQKPTEPIFPDATLGCLENQSKPARHSASICATGVFAASCWPRVRPARTDWQLNREARKQPIERIRQTFFSAA